MVVWLEMDTKVLKEVTLEKGQKTGMKGMGEQCEA
jgi:hypothetical protein